MYTWLVIFRKKCIDSDCLENQVGLYLNINISTALINTFSPLRIINNMLGICYALFIYVLFSPSFATMTSKQSLVTFGVKLDKMFGTVNESVLNNIKQLYPNISPNSNYFTSEEIHRSYAIFLPATWLKAVVTLYRTLEVC